MDNQLQPITSMETLEVNARERFSERLTVTSVGTLALNLFALSCVWQYSLKLALSETVDWVCLIFAFLTTAFVVMTELHGSQTMYNIAPKSPPWVGRK